MPVQRVSGGYRFGNSGKVYKGANAKEKAMKQGIAISYAEKAAGRKPDIPVK